MRKTYLFALLALIMVFAFTGFAFANDMKTAEQKAQDEASLRPTVPFQSSVPQRVDLDEQVLLYGTTFENANDWTIVDGGEGTATWECISSANQTHDVPMFDTPPFMWVDSDDANSTEHLIESLISPAMDASSYAYVYLVCDIEFLNVTIGRDSLEILFTDDDGTTWESIHVFSDDSREYPGVFDISAMAAGEASFKIAFNYDDDDGCMWYAGIDNFKVYGCDDVGDFEPPVVTITAGPTASFPGFDRPVVATVTDNVGIDVVTLKYGLVENLGVPEILSLEMTATGNENEYSAVIPGDFGAVEDTIAFLVEAYDVAGNIGVEPAPVGNAYIFEIYPMTEYYLVTEMETYEWLEVSATGTDLDMGDSSIEEILFSDYDGFDSFTFYGVEYTSVYVNSNGWICFEPGAASYTGMPTLPSTSTPNATIVMCGGDLYAGVVGDVYVGVVDGKFVIQWGDDNGGCRFYYADNGPKGQIVLDSETNTAYINYDTITGFTDDGDPYVYTHNMGIENPTGRIAEVIYSGNQFTYPVDETSFMIYSPMGGIEGVVTATEGGAALSEVNVTVFEGETEVGSAQTDDLGAYSVNVLDGTYSVVFAKAGYTVNTVNDVVVADFDMTELNVTLDEETTTETLSGVVYSADTDNPVNGIVVTLVETEESVTTGADGAYSFADEAVGNYTIEINAELGLTTYHDFSAAVTISEGMDPVDFSVSMIMAPENLQPTAANESVVLTFDAPANHAAPEVVMNYINELELIVSLHDQNLKLADNIDEVRAQLATYRNIYENLTSISLDDISDFAGYRVKVDGTIDATVYPSETITISGLTNDQEYTFAVAADYGYGDDYLLFTADVNATPSAPDPYRYEATTYNWVEIRTNDLGTRVPWTADDKYSGPIDFPAGMVFTFYGVPYSSFNIASNGFLSMTATNAFNTASPYSNVVIPTAAEPNALIAPHWDWTEISDEDAYSAYYYFDATNSQIVVTWYCPEWGYPATGNILEYQAVLDLTTNDIVYNYNTASDHWPETVTVGVENEDGTIGVQYENVPMSNGSALLFTQAPEITGTISGVVKHASASGNAIEDVEVWVDGRAEAMATTDDTGAFTFTIAIGDYDLSFVHDGYWTEEEEDVTVTEGNDTDLGEIYMTKPIPGVSPSSIEITYNITTGGAVSETFDLSNTGTGPMEYVASIQILQSVNAQETPGQPVEIRNTPDFAKQRASEEVGPVYTGSALDETWDLIQSYEDIETGTGAADNMGVCLTANNFYVAGFYYATVTKFAFDGSVVSSEDIPDAYQSTSTDYPGFNDIASDPNGYFYGANDDGKVLKFSEDFSEVVELADLDFWGITLAYDYDNSLAYVSNFGSSFTKVDASGNTTTLSSIGGAYGMTYVPNDPDGYTIYAHVDGDDGSSYVYRYDPSTDTWESNPVFTAYDLSGTNDNPGGIAGGERSTGSFDFILTKQDTETDCADLYEGYPLQQWLTVSPAEGTVQAAGSQQMTVTVNADNDPGFDFEDGDVVNAAVVISGPHMDDVSVLVEINFEESSAPEVDGLPTMYALHQNYPNPFNPTTEIKFDLVQAQNVKLVVFNTLGQEVARLMDAPMQAGYHVVTFDASTFASGVYFYRIETEAFTSMKKMVMVK